MKRMPETHRQQFARQAARGLGWFSIGLGVVALLAPAPTARATGQRGAASWVRTSGVREIATGVGLLSARNPTPWLWARVGGDLLDAATLLSHRDSTGAGRRAAWALAAVGAVAAADVASALLNQRADESQGGSGRSVERRDYSGRSGLPGPPNDMRGRALRDFVAPEDMRIPELLRPWTS